MALEKAKLKNISPIDCIIEESENYGALYLGNIEAARNTDLLRKYNVRAVLTISSIGINYNKDVINFHKVINIADSDESDISVHFEEGNCN